MTTCKKSPVRILASAQTSFYVVYYAHVLGKIIKLANREKLQQSRQHKTAYQMV